jgi:hypothetical protein
LERSTPIRSWNGLVRAPVSPGAGGSAEPGGTDRVDDVIVRSVELGYRVIDEYVKRGQAAAQRMQHGAYGANDMARDAQGIAGQLVRSATDLAGAWAEFFALANRDGNHSGNGQAPPHANGASAPNGHAASTAGVPPAPAPMAASAAAPWRVRLRVRATRPVETDLHLCLVPSDHPLVVHALRAEDGTGPRLDEVGVEAADGVATIVVAIPDAHPAGTYAASVFDDATNLPVGTITVVLSAA